MAKKTTTGTTDIIQNAMDRLIRDVESCVRVKDNALSEFRRAAKSLETANQGLITALDNYDKLSAFIAEQHASTSKMIADNEAVKSKILDIIGPDN